MDKLIPQDLTFVISTGESFTLRPYNLADKIWFQTEFAGKPDAGIESTVRAAFRLLKDKSKYKPIKVEEISEDGESQFVMRGGWKLFMDNFISNKDVEILVSSIIQVMKNSDPEPEENKESATGEPVK